MAGWGERFLGAVHFVHTFLHPCHWWVSGDSNSPPPPDIKSYILFIMVATTESYRQNRKIRSWSKVVLFTVTAKGYQETSDPEYNWTSMNTKPLVNCHHGLGQQFCISYLGESFWEKSFINPDWHTFSMPHFTTQRGTDFLGGDLLRPQCNMLTIEFIVLRKLVKSNFRNAFLMAFRQAILTQFHGK